MRLAAVVAFLGLAPFAFATTALQCLQELAHAEGRFHLFVEKAPLAVPGWITEPATLAALATGYRAEDGDAIRRLFHQRRTLDGILQKASRAMEAILYGRGGTDPVPLTPEELAIWTQDEFDFHVRETAMEAAGHNPWIGVARRQPAFVWFGYVAMAQGSALFPEFLPHVIEPYAIHLPASLEIVLAGTPGHDAFVQAAVRMAYSTAFPTGEKVDFFADDRVGPFDYFAPITRSPETFRGIVDDLTRFVRDPNAIATFDGTGRLKSYRGSAHSFALESLSELLLALAGSMSRLETSDARWTALWHWTLDEAMAAILYRDRVQSGDYHPSVGLYENQWYARSRASVLQALLAARHRTSPDRFARYFAATL